ncbi:MAG TPA: T9SS type A sorting domain-containing protein [Bacteroidales bacterium]|nr:T9SS type A sorting domain-containing protein [Bacteroidales bacterium]
MKKIIYLFALLSLTLNLNAQSGFSFSFSSALESDNQHFTGLYAFENKYFATTDYNNASYYYDGETLYLCPDFDINLMSGVEKSNEYLFVACIKYRYSGETSGYYYIYTWHSDSINWEKSFENQNQEFTKIFVLNENEIYVWGHDSNKKKYIWLFNPNEKTLTEMYNFHDINTYSCEFMEAKSSNNILLLLKRGQKGLWQRYNGVNLEVLFDFGKINSFDEIKASHDKSIFFFLPDSFDKLYLWKEEDQKMDSIIFDMSVQSFFPLDNENLMLFSGAENYCFNIKSGEKERVYGGPGPVNMSDYAGKTTAFVASGTKLYFMFITGSNVEFKEINNISLYPNPANNVLRLECPVEGAKHVKILDLRGQILMEESFYDSDNMSLNIANLSSGVYVIQINTTKGVVNKKFVKN